MRRRGPSIAAVLVLSVALGAGAPARAAPRTTLAVLPFSPAAASDAYAGLGQALSGMVVADILAIEGIDERLTLVERDRLGDLLAEIDLGKSGFIDERTAQKLGRGVSAELVLSGTFTVLGDKMTLTARIIDVETGAVRFGSEASGAVDEFVSIEKELSLALLRSLELKLSRRQKRKVLLQAPTEVFSAFAVYSEALAAQDGGDVEKARQAYRKALVLDPEFEAAAAALRDLKDAIGRSRAGARTEMEKTFAETNARLLAAAPPLAARGRAPTQGELVAWVLRVTGLANEGRVCDQYREMRRYLDRVDWRVREPERPRGKGVLSYEVGKAARAIGAVRMPHGTDVPRIAHEGAVRGHHLFRSTPRFIVGPNLYDWINGKPGAALLFPLTQCFEPDDALAEVDDIIAQLKRRGLGTEDVARNREGVQLLDVLHLAWIVLHARGLGSGPRMSARAEQLLSRVHVANPLEATRAQRARRELVLRVLERATRLAEAQDDTKRYRLGLAEETIEGVVQAVADLDEDVLVLEGELCGQLAAAQPKARTWLEDRAAWKAKYEGELFKYADRRIRDGAVQFYGPARDLGCLKGRAARLAGYPELLAFLDVALERKRPEISDRDRREQCRRQTDGLAQQLKMARQYPRPEAQYPGETVRLLRQYYRAAADGCLPLPD